MIRAQKAILRKKAYMHESVSARKMGNAITGKPRGEYTSVETHGFQGRRTVNSKLYSTSMQWRKISS